MRIAILTLPLHVNFGGILQCYALQTVLERMGHEVSVLNTDFVNVDYKIRIGLFIKRLFKTCIGKESKFYGWKTEREIRRQFTQPFINKYIHTRNIKKLSLLKEDEYDVIIVGSDQIWRSHYYQPIANAYLKFTKGWDSIKRIAYAASFGTDELDYTVEEIQECASLLKLFNAVSVREKSGIDLCEKYFNVNAIQTLDPTLLLLKEDYLKLTNNLRITNSQQGLFYYFLDETQEKLNFVDKMANNLGLDSFCANNPNVECYSVNFEQEIQLSIEQWLMGFENAKYVITDSFHGCVFSILFNKPFIVISNQRRGINRLISLLSLLGLQNRLIDEIGGVPEINMINFEEVRMKLNVLRNNSLNFLENALS